MEHAYLAGIAITFFLAFILANKKNKSTADTILLLWLCVIGAHLGLFYLFFTQKYVDYPYFLGLEGPLPLLQGPFLYAYTAALSNRPLPLRARWFHFGLPLLWYLFYLPFLMLPAGQKILVYQQQGAGYEWITQMTVWALKISGVVYVILSLRLLKKYQKALPHQFSYTEKINLNWLRYLIWGIAVIWLIIFFGYDDLIFFAVVLFVGFIGYFGIRQVGIFTNFHPIDAVQTDSPDDRESNKKYERSGLNPETAEAIHRALTRVMDEKKLYANPELSLSDLAQILDIHPNYLSQVINTFEQKNFFDYINAKRVEAFMRMAALPENQKYTLLALAFECGFNSKTAFNRNFKKTTGLPPSEYMTRQL